MNSGIWTASIRLNEWALPLFIRSSDDDDVAYFAIHFLCAVISYERWKV